MKVSLDCALVLHSHSKLVTLWLNSLNNMQFHSMASRENQAYSAVTGVTGYGP